MCLCQAGGGLRTPGGHALVSLSGAYWLRFLEVGCTDEGVVSWGGTLENKAI